MKTRRKADEEEEVNCEGCVKWPNIIAVKKSHQRSCLGSRGDTCQDRVEWVSGEDGRNSVNIVRVFENVGYEEQMEIGTYGMRAGAHAERAPPLAVYHN